MREPLAHSPSAPLLSHITGRAGIFFSRVFRSKNQENTWSARIIMQQVQFYNMFVILCRVESHLMKEFEINNTPYGLRVMATDPPTNKSVGSCPKDIKTPELNARVAKYESIWMGGNPDWTALQLHLGKTADTLFEHDRYFRVFSNVSSKENKKKNDKCRRKWCLLRLNTCKLTNFAKVLYSRL